MGGGLRGRGSAREVKQRESESSARKGLKGSMLREKGIRQSTFCVFFFSHEQGKEGKSLKKRGVTYGRL